MGQTISGCEEPEGPGDTVDEHYEEDVVAGEPEIVDEIPPPLAEIVAVRSFLAVDLLTVRRFAGMLWLWWDCSRATWSGKAHIR